ncbi:BnaCnng49060D [Brassica napus]|uniref:(rape) hypothetical protein n=1 Tax=Brassica napus TaxID=3708 RepID=A0A078JJA4_BRANA|nr:unnamed protein product [Brassica napus]CDY65901.1 BnaCnng49060D [Brassica napus]
MQDYYVNVLLLLILCFILLKHLKEEMGLGYLAQKIISVDPYLQHPGIVLRMCAVGNCYSCVKITKLLLRCFR